jgi:hypothetical protein
MFDTELHFGDITPSWIAFHVPGTSHIKVVQITGGRVGHQGQIDLGNRCNILVTTEKSIYTYNPDEHDGNIEIDEFNLFTGAKVRTLDTKIPWVTWVHHRENADDGYRFISVHRMVADAHAVGNKLVVLISSVGSMLNTIVTFPLPRPSLQESGR